jgi:hypothetical protein
MSFFFGFEIVCASSVNGSLSRSSCSTLKSVDMAVEASAGVIKDLRETLCRDGTIQDAADSLASFAQFNEIIGVEEQYRLAERFGVK